MYEKVVPNLIQVFPVSRVDIILRMLAMNSDIIKEKRGLHRCGCDMSTSKTIHHHLGRNILSWRWDQSAPSIIAFVDQTNAEKSAACITLCQPRCSPGV